MKPIKKIGVLIILEFSFLALWLIFWRYCKKWNQCSSFGAWTSLVLTNSFIEISLQDWALLFKLEILSTPWFPIPKLNPSLFCSACEQNLDNRWLTLLMTRSLLIETIFWLRTRKVLPGNTRPSWSVQVSFINDVTQKSLWCVFWPSFGCCVLPKAVQNAFLLFASFSTFQTKKKKNLETGDIYQSIPVVVLG